MFFSLSIREREASLTDFLEKIVKRRKKPALFVLELGLGRASYA